MNINRGHSPRGMNQRTGASIVAVCRDWYHAGIHMLYEEVYIWELISVSSFLRTIETSPLHLGFSVRELNISCLISLASEESTGSISGHYGMLVNALHNIIDLCLNLETLTFAPVEDVDNNSSLVSFRFDASSGSAASFSLNCTHIAHIHELRLGGCMFLTLDISSFAVFAQTLTVLSLDLSHLRPGDTAALYDVSFGTTEWPSLKWLRFRTGDAEVRSLMYTVSIWDIPLLENFTFIFSPRNDCLSWFIEGYLGSRLRYLSLGSERAAIHTWTRYSDYQRQLFRSIECCPQLEHLVLDSAIFVDWSPRLSPNDNLSHSCLRWIDIWIDLDQSSTKARRTLHGFDFNATRCPRLQCVRYFDSALLSTEIGLDLPAVLSPRVSCSHDNEPIQIRYFGVDIKQQGCYVYRNDMEYVEDGFDLMCLLGEDKDRGSRGNQRRNQRDSDLAWVPSDDEGESDYDTDCSNDSTIDSLYEELAGAAKMEVCEEKGKRNTRVLRRSKRRR
ncbi:hypothetical protein Moror_12079 [Moniliophthora roreri MCA 2997]|nr:hypothetical protein Moror_12079 [Moniliophthora roreri MCA 2997]